MAEWLIAGGSVAGRHHHRAGRNNQDAFAWRRENGTVAAAVCDGCSSGEHSELGARLGANLVVEALLRHAAAPWAEMWQAVRDDVLAALAPAARTVDVGDHLLFTVVAVVARGDEASVAAIGDGGVVWDGVPLLARDADDAPDYLGYGLLGAAPAFRVLGAGPCRALALATDGAEAVDLGALVGDELVWKNPDGLRRRLAVAARGGAVTDDTTVVLLRRRP